MSPRTKTGSSERRVRGSMVRVLRRSSMLVKTLRSSLVTAGLDSKFLLTMPNSLSRF